MPAGVRLMHMLERDSKELTKLAVPMAGFGLVIGDPKKKLNSCGVWSKLIRREVTEELTGAINNDRWIRRKAVVGALIAEKAAVGAERVPDRIAEAVEARLAISIPDRSRVTRWAFDTSQIVIVRFASEHM